MSLALSSTSHIFSVNKSFSIKSNLLLDPDLFILIEYMYTCTHVPSLFIMQSQTFDQVYQKQVSLQ